MQSYLPLDTEPTDRTMAQAYGNQARRQPRLVSLRPDMKPKGYLLPLNLQAQRTHASSHRYLHTVNETDVQTLVRLGNEYLSMMINAEKKQPGRIEQRRQPIVSIARSPSLITPLAGDEQTVHTLVERVLHQVDEQCEAIVDEILSA